MQIKEINEIEFDNYANNHILRNYYQTSKYGNLMKKFGYTPIYIAVFEEEKIIGVALILSKYIAINVKYGYSPRGFLIDYQNEYYLREFTRLIKKYFFKKGFAFIKINPEITLAEVFPGKNNKSLAPKSRPRAREKSRLLVDGLRRKRLVCRSKTMGTDVGAGPDRS